MGPQSSYYIYYLQRGRHSYYQIKTTTMQADFNQGDYLIEVPTYKAIRYQLVSLHEINITL